MSTFSYIFLHFPVSPGILTVDRARGIGFKALRCSLMYAPTYVCTPVWLEICFCFVLLSEKLQVEVEISIVAWYCTT